MRDLQAEETTDLSHLESEGRAIRDTLHELLLRTKHPNTLGVKGLLPQEFKAQVEETEARLLAWKKNLTPLVNGALSPEQKAKIISFYFTQCSFLVQVRILGGEKAFPVDDAWQKTFSLDITAQTLYELSAGDSPLSLVTTPESPVILGVKLESLKEVKLSTELPLQMSGLHIQALRQMALSNDVTPQTYFSLVQSLMVGWLLESLDKTHLLMRGEKRSAPPLGEFEEIQGNVNLKKNMIQEKMIRELLISQIPDVPVFFADDIWIQGLISIILAPQFHEEYFKIYKEGFQKSEPIDVKETFAMIAKAYPLPIKQLSLKEKTELIRTWYAQARLSVVFGMMPESEEWTKETKTAVIDLLQGRLEDYLKLLPQEPFEKWAKDSQWDEAHQETLRTKYVVELIELSKKLKAQMDLPKEELPIDLITLDLALEKDFLMMGIEPATLQRKMLVVQAPSLKEAQALYQSLLAELKESISSHSELPDQSRGQAPAKNPLQGSSLSERVQAKVYEKLEKELKEFLKVGEWFFGEGQPSHPDPQRRRGEGSLGSLPLTDAQKEAYQEMVKIRMMGEHHILAMIGGVEKVPLYERLSRLTPTAPNDIGWFARGWIDEALTKIEEEAIEKISAVARAKALEDIQTIVAKSPLIHVMISQFPAFKGYHDEMKKKGVSANFSEMSWDELFHRTTYPGFTFLLLHWVAKFVPGVRTHPLMRALDAAIGPYLSYFLVTSFSMVGVDLVWQYKRIEDKEEDIEILKEYLETSAGDDAFSDFLTVTRAQEERDMMWSQWKSQRAFEVAFLVGIPVFGRVAKGLIGQAKDLYYAKLYRQVGFEPKNYSWNEMEIRDMSFATVERIKQDHPSNKKLQEWLIARVEGAEKKLLKIIQRSEKSMQRKSRHFREEFKALGLQERCWDPEEITVALGRIKSLHQKNLISQETLDDAIRASQALLREVRAPFTTLESRAPLWLRKVPFMTLDPQGPTAGLQLRLLLSRPIKAEWNGKPVTVILNGTSPYVDAQKSLDPVLERHVETVKDANGHEIEIISYQRISPYVPRKEWPFFRGMP